MDQPITKEEVEKIFDMYAVSQDDRKEFYEGILGNDQGLYSEAEVKAWLGYVE